MKKAVILASGHQYLVSEGDVIDVELLKDEKNISFEPLLVIDGEKTIVGTPVISDVKVSAEVLGEVRGDKVTAIRYKAKKRVRKVHGHKQTYNQIKIGKIA